MNDPSWIELAGDCLKAGCIGGRIGSRLVGEADTHGRDPEKGDYYEQKFGDTYCIHGLMEFLSLMRRMSLKIGMNFRSYE